MAMIRAKNNLVRENLAKVAPGCKLFHVEQRVGDENGHVVGSSANLREIDAVGICSTWNGAPAWKQRRSTRREKYA
jgi:hypothetical protein